MRLKVLPLTALLMFLVLAVDNVASTVALCGAGFCPDSPKDYMLFDDRDELVRGCAEPLHAVERALQDVGGGHAVDHLGAALARGICLDQMTLHGRGRQPLVPKCHRHGDMDGEVAGEGAGGLGPRALGPVEIEGEADDERRRPLAFRRSAAMVLASAVNLPRRSVS